MFLCSIFWLVLGLFFEPYEGGINNFITPMLAILSVDSLLPAMAVAPWLGFLKGLIVTLLMAFAVQFCSKQKLFWRT
jgi:hypothetical protein